jgi:phosphohistidine phosphatase
MELYLLRHGDAEPRGTLTSDAERALTAKGKRDVEAVAAQAKIGNVRPDVVLTSPLRRAKETGVIAQKVLGVKRMLETKALLPDISPEALWKELSTIAEAEHILLCGHEPSFSRLTQFLLRARVAVDFKKGAMLRITTPRAGEPQGELRWMITPRVVGRK